MNHVERGTVVIARNGGKAFAMLSVASLYLFPKSECAKTYSTGVAVQIDGGELFDLPFGKDSVNVCTGRMSTFISAYSSTPY
jgi:hypothetical protein